MKKLALAVLAVLMVCGVAQADQLRLSDVLDKLPAVNNGVIWNIDSNDIQYVSTVTLASAFEQKLKLDVGWSPEQTGVVAVSYQVFKASEVTKIPIVEYVVVEPMVFVSLNRISLGLGNGKDGNELGYGVGCKLLSVTF